MTDAAVIDDRVNERLVAEIDGHEAELVYRRNGSRFILLHTGVPDALSGRGIGGRLVAAAVEVAHQENLTLVPLCPYAREWLGRHPDATAGVSMDWEEDGAPPAPSRP
jgi:predicted GNAT family acetyltransferase